MESFINPVANMPIRKFISFGFPIGVHANSCQPNTDMRLEEPTHEVLYGNQPPWDPRKMPEQGYPCIYERPEPFVEAEDPGVWFWPKHDQIVDKDNNVCIDHTAHLKGSFVKYLIQQNNKSVVKVFFNPLTTNAAPILFNEVTTQLVPAGNAPNQWYWRTNREDELIFTLHCDDSIRDPKKYPPGVYRLIVKWEFWHTNPNGRDERLPISGFSSDIAFEIAEASNPL